MMRAHTANELIDRADILGPDGSTVLASGVACGVKDITGRVREQAQLEAAQTDHTITFWALDAASVTPAGYIRVGGVLYIVDYAEDPRNPRPGVWLEVYCHVERTAS